MSSINVQVAGATSSSNELVFNFPAAASLEGAAATTTLDAQLYLTASHRIVPRRADQSEQTTGDSGYVFAFKVKTLHTTWFEIKPSQGLEPLRLTPTSPDGTATVTVTLTVKYRGGPVKGEETSALRIDACIVPAAQVDRLRLEMASSAQQEAASASTSKSARGDRASALEGDIIRELVSDKSAESSRGGKATRGDLRIDVIRVSQRVPVTLRLGHATTTPMTHLALQSKDHVVTAPFAADEPSPPPRPSPLLPRLDDHAEWRSNTTPLLPPPSAVTPQIVPSQQTQVNAPLSSGGPPPLRGGGAGRGAPLWMAALIIYLAVLARNRFLHF